MKMINIYSGLIKVNKTGFEDNVHDNVHDDLSIIKK